MKIPLLISLLFALFYTINCDECPKGWVRVLNKCYFKLEVLVTKEENHKFCNELKADLPSIGSELENLMVSAMTPGASSWLSLVKSLSRDFKWGGFHDLTFTKWAQNQPSSQSGPACVVINAGFWSVVPCDSKHFLMCQLDIDKDTLSKNLQCENGWLRFQDKCFITNEISTKLIDNELHCRKVGATMVTIHSELENEFINAITKRETFYWIGLNRRKIGSPTFEWFDGTKLDYTKWDTHEHDPRYGDQPEPHENNTCIFNGYWHDCGYSHDRYPHLCQKYMSDIYGDVNDRVYSLSQSVNYLKDQVIEIGIIIHNVLQGLTTSASTIKR